MIQLKQEILIALGANLPSEVGGPAETLRAALGELGALGLAPVAVSRFYRTPAFPAGAGPDYVNAAARIEAAMPPTKVLSTLHKVEAMFGRERLKRWGQRSLDLDLLAVEDLVLPDTATHAEWRDLPPETQQSVAPDQLILPHPRLQDRSFVLVPLMDVAPDWVHPALGLSVRKMCEARPKAERDTVKPL